MSLRAKPSLRTGDQSGAGRPSAVVFELPDVPPEHFEEESDEDTDSVDSYEAPPDRPRRRKHRSGIIANMALQGLSRGRTGTLRNRRSLIARLQEPQIQVIFQCEKFLANITAEVAVFSQPLRQRGERPIDALRRVAGQVAEHKRQELALHRKMLGWNISQDQANLRKDLTEARAYRDRLAKRRECIQDVFTSYRTIQRPKSDRTDPFLEAAGDAPSAAHSPAISRSPKLPLTVSPSRSIASSAPDLSKFGRGGHRSDRQETAEVGLQLAKPRAFDPERLGLSSVACAGGMEAPDSRRPSSAAEPRLSQSNNSCEGEQSRRPPQRRGRAFHKLKLASEVGKPKDAQRAQADGCATGRLQAGRPRARHLGELARRPAPGAPPRGAAAFLAPAGDALATRASPSRPSSTGALGRRSMGASPSSAQVPSPAASPAASLSASSPSVAAPRRRLPGHLDDAADLASFPSQPQTPALLARSPALSDLSCSPKRASQFPGMRQVEIEGPEHQQALVCYLRACEDTGIAPKPIPFITGQSQKLTTQRQLVDKDLSAITASLAGASELQEVDLEGNTMLTDASVAPFLKRLASLPAAGSCERLSLKQCRLLGVVTLDTLASALTGRQGFAELRHLELSGVAIPSKCQTALCQAIREHRILTSVGLAEVGLGHSRAVAKQCIEDLLFSRALEELDLGWNCFTADILEHLGECLVRAPKERDLGGALAVLNISNCSAASAGDAPVLYFLEKLSQDRNLTSMDVSLNRIDHSGALLLEDALDGHRQLEDIDVSHNPLGAPGVRCMLRLLFRNRSGLMHFRNDGCDSIADTFDLGDRNFFNQTTPDGSYSLDLELPSHRAMLRTLYKICWHYGLSAEGAFSGVKMTGPPGAARAGDPTRDFAVPTAGRLHFGFKAFQGLAEALAGAEGEKFGVFFDRHSEITRLPLGRHKEAAFLVLWRGLTHGGRLTLLDALSQDFTLTYAQVSALCKTRSLVVDVLRRTVHSMQGGAQARYLAIKLAPTFGDRLQAKKRLANFMDFNPENATGHYKFSLDNHADFALADRLLLLSRWEARIAQSTKQKDVSQLGDWAHVRNVYYRGQSLNHSVQHWSLPSADLLEFDYVAGRRLDPGTRAMDSDSFERILQKLCSSSLPGADKIHILRLVSDQMLIEAMQLRELLGSVASDPIDRADMFVLFFFRVVDIQNEKVFRVRFTSQAELAVLRRRLGHMVLFPFVQPEMARFQLDLSFYDERLAANTIIAYSIKEGRDNLRGESPEDRIVGYVHADGTVDPMDIGVPRSWDDFERMPTEGTLYVTYVCGPEHRNMDFRIHCLRTFGRWELLRGEEESIMWWAALTDAPPDVLGFLEFLVSHYDSLEDAFKRLDLLKQKQVTFMGFEEGLVRLGCRKFRGKEEKARIANLFRWLDVDAGGKVSLMEWNVLGYMWKEMRQTIKEFVKFLERHFSEDADDSMLTSAMSAAMDRIREADSTRGKAALVFAFGDVLEKAWGKLDEDESGEISEQEWMGLVRARLRYFGPCDTIFKFLDSDDTGSVSWEEFERLEVFLQGGSAKRRETLSRMSSGLTSLKRGASRRKQLEMLQGGGRGSMARTPSKGAVGRSSVLKTVSELRDRLHESSQDVRRASTEASQWRAASLPESRAGSKESTASVPSRPESRAGTKASLAQGAESRAGSKRLGRVPSKQRAG